MVSLCNALFGAWIPVRRTPKGVGEFLPGTAYTINCGPQAFADHAGLHRVAVGWIEQGKRVPSFRTLLNISQGFGRFSEGSLIEHASATLCDDA